MLTPHELSMLLQVAHTPQNVDRSNPDFNELVAQAYVELVPDAPGADPQAAVTARACCLLAGIGEQTPCDPSIHASSVCREFRDCAGRTGGCRYRSMSRACAVPALDASWNALARDAIAGGSTGADTRL